MKISNIVLRNFRKYDHVRFNFNDRFTVLIGDNGSGKTTILDALSAIISTYFQGSKIQVGRSGIKKEDARLVIIEKAGQVFLEPQKEVYLTAEGLFNGRPVFWRRDMGDRGGKAKELVEKGAAHRKSISKGESLDLPLLLYYGSGRSWDIQRAVKTGKPGSQLDAYRFSLDPKSDQKAFEKWLKKLSYAELQKKKAIPALQTVKEAVLCIVPNAKDFYHDTDEDQIMIDLDHEGLMPFNYLSDGFRNMVAMAADIAYRASLLNPHYGVDAARSTTGIVLIDEIDLHLHPKWQRRIVQGLKTAFPSLQFVSTTYSPFILQSLDPGEVIDLNQSPDIQMVTGSPENIAAPGPANPFSNRSIEDIVEDVMGG
jgi:predicted ATP-binding protein involved in virulence